MSWVLNSEILKTEPSIHEDYHTQVEAKPSLFNYAGALITDNETIIIGPTGQHFLIAIKLLQQSLRALK